VPAGRIGAGVLGPGSARAGRPQSASRGFFPKVAGKSSSTNSQVLMIKPREMACIALEPVPLLDPPEYADVLEYPEGKPRGINYRTMPKAPDDTGWPPLRPRQDRAAIATASPPGGSRPTAVTAQAVPG
jgi:hypothetical protein